MWKLYSGERPKRQTRFKEADDEDNDWRAVYIFSIILKKKMEGNRKWIKRKQEMWKKKLFSLDTSKFVGTISMKLFREKAQRIYVMSVGKGSKQRRHTRTYIIVDSSWFYATWTIFLFFAFIGVFQYLLLRCIPISVNYLCILFELSPQIHVLQYLGYNAYLLV